MLSRNQFSVNLTSVYPSFVLPLEAGLEFDPSREEQFFPSIPHHAGVFLLETRAAPGASGAKPYLARTADLRRAAERLLRVPDAASKKLNLRDVATKFSFRVTGSRFEQSLVLYHQARARSPNGYRAFLRLRPPALLKISLRNSYPRCYVTRRIFRDGGYYFGPFVSRQAAEAFANEFLDLFKIRRCQIKIRRDPSFPGCIYSEMKMCLAPCFAGCTKDDYDAEVNRVLDTLESGGASLTGAMEREREAASEATDFEHAAAWHKKLEKVHSVIRGLPEIAQRVDGLSAVILQRAVREKTVAMFVIVNGLIAEPLFICFDESGEPRSVEAVLRQHFEELQSRDAAAQSESHVKTSREVTAPSGERFKLCGETAEREEHLSLVARWFYSKPRAGEILFRDTDWPYRKILRACARVLAAAAPDRK
ncbi:MAG TPA: hypothetical protein VGU63_10025 [Candidatus Acidoferrales bacterium]|nr:hypothetical protein [Candidatus Acidoferrales bacterium]